ncbi:MAG: hypothetical protein SGI74_06695 [Oligoflexia bacterium]|nr:hypothetical protein [Oligoflexia bacterium]
MSKATKGVKTNSKAKSVKKTGQIKRHLKLVPKVHTEKKEHNEKPDLKHYQKPPYTHAFSKFMNVHSPVNTSSYVKKINLKASRRRAG